MISPKHINTKNSIEKVGGVGLANMALAQNLAISEAIGPKRPKFDHPYAFTQPFAITASAMEGLNAAAAYGAIALPADVVKQSSASMMDNPF